MEQSRDQESAAAALARQQGVPDRWRSIPPYCNGYGSATGRAYAVPFLHARAPPNLVLYSHPQPPSPQYTSISSLHQAPSYLSVPSYPSLPFQSPLSTLQMPPPAPLQGSLQFQFQFPAVSHLSASPLSQRVNHVVATACPLPSYSLPSYASPSVSFVCKMEEPVSSIWAPDYVPLSPPPPLPTYPSCVKPEPVTISDVVKTQTMNIQVPCSTVKTELVEVKTEKPEILYEDDIELEEDEDYEDGCLLDHLCDGMIVDGVCQCHTKDADAAGVSPSPQPLAVKSSVVCKEEVIDVPSDTVSRASPPSSPLRSPVETASHLLKTLEGLVSDSAARDPSSSAVVMAPSGGLVADEPSVEPTVPCLPAPTNPAANTVSQGPLCYARKARRLLKGREGRFIQRASMSEGNSDLDVPAPLEESLPRKPKDIVVSGSPAPVVSQLSTLDRMLEEGSLDRAIRLPKLETENEVTAEDAFRLVVETTRENFDRVRTLIQKECEEKAVSIRRPDLKAAQFMRHKGLWLNFSDVEGHIKGVRVGDAFPFRIYLCVIGLHRHIRAGIGYVPEKDSKRKEAYATSVVIGKDKVYKDDVDNGETVVYTGQGGLVGRGKEASDQKLVRGNLALWNSHKLEIPIRVIRGHACVRSPSGVMYTYDGLYEIVERSFEKGLNERMVYKFTLQRLKDQDPLLPFAADATPLQAVTTGSRVQSLPNAISSSLLLKETPED